MLQSIAGLVVILQKSFLNFIGILQSHNISYVFLFHFIHPAFILGLILFNLSILLWIIDPRYHKHSLFDI